MNRYGVTSVIILSLLLSSCRQGILEKSVFARVDDVRLSDRCFSVLREALRKEEKWVKVHAAEALIAHGEKKEAIAIFQKELRETKDEQYIVGVARVLARAGDKSAVPIIMGILEDKKSNGRVHAAETLGKLKYGGARKLLRRVCREDDPILAAYALGSLVKCGEREALPALTNALNNKDGRDIIVWSLEDVDNLDAATLKKLKYIQKTDQSALARIYSAVVLARHGDVSVITVLKSNIESTEPGIRLESIVALGQIKETSSLSEITNLLEDKVPDVRVRAAEAILAIMASRF